MEFTPRGRQVAKYILSGYETPEIAKELKISQITVKRHLQRLYRQFGIDDGVKRVKLARILWNLSTAAERSQPKSESLSS
jgi:DNA-binding NarL/FixJ family response regulator